MCRENYVKVDDEETGDSADWHRTGSNSGHFGIIYNTWQLFRLTEWLSASQVGYFSMMLVTPFHLFLCQKRKLNVQSYDLQAIQLRYVPRTLQSVQSLKTEATSLSKTLVFTSQNPRCHSPDKSMYPPTRLQGVTVQIRASIHLPDCKVSQPR